MPADVSRIRFDPLRDFAGVLLQQGRVLLDADFNEHVALLDRRLRAEASDVASFGPDPDRAGVAWVPRQTPDAFRITASGGSITIGRGRMYVDGLLADNHGGDRTGFDPLLSERTGTADTPYGDQPYWPTPDPLPEEGRHLAYLDVWQRELTHIEDPSLTEIAVGVDATARWQTAWQVRLMPAEGINSCNFDDDELEEWSELIRPSSGRLSTHEIAVPPSEDPCELPPEAGYRGLENQTYRVEIHGGGGPDEATFKWSRENASVAMAVVEMVSPTVLRLATVGRDDVLRVSTGDWVEIIDDNYELGGAPGEMRQVTVDDAERTITFNPALPADLQPADAADAAARHLRVRRWDSDGLVTVPASDAAQEGIEFGIAVSFAAETGGRFRTGDYWVFAARTADGSFEQLVAAPPRGVHHHYARLAIVDLPDDATSCRRLWPPLPVEGGEGCDCTVCVSVESHDSGALTIQEAIDQVRESGGTVCLAAGIYNIGPGIDIDQARSVRIRGQGLATVLVARGEAVTITQSRGVTVENLALVSGSAAPAAVRVRGAGLVTLQDLGVLSYGRADGAGAAIALEGVAVLVNVRRNVLVARTGVASGGRERGLYTAGLRVEDNVVLGFERGIDLGGNSAYLFECRVSRNDVLMSREAAIVATGAVAPGGSLEVTGNKIAAGGTGIAVGGDALVDANSINRWGQQESQFEGDGIVVVEGELTAPPGHVRITGNRIHDRRGTGIALRRAVRGIMIKQNVVAGAAHGIAVEGRAAAERVAIENNEVSDIGGHEQETQRAFGIFVARAGAVAVAGNRVARLGEAVAEGGLLGGIVIMGSEDVRVAGNSVDEMARRDFSATAAGIAVLGPFERASVSDNSVRFSREQPGPEGGDWWALLIQSAGAGERAAAPAPAKAVPTERGTVMVATDWAFVAPQASDNAGIGANTLSGGGRQPACVVRVRGDVVADGNQCLYALLEDPTAVLLQASSVAASSNRVRGDRGMLVIVTDEDRFAAVANLTAGGTHLGGPGNGLPGPWDALNPFVS